MEIVKVLKGEKALEVIEELLDNGFVLTPDYRLVMLRKGHVLVKKSAACGPTTSDSIDIRQVWPKGSNYGAVRPEAIKK